MSIATRLGYGRAVPLATGVGLAAALALLTAACGSSSPTAATSTGGSGASSTTVSSSTTTSSAAGPACDPTAMVTALQSQYGAQDKIAYNNHVVCAGNLAEISVLIESAAASQPGYQGPMGSPHGALMQYSGGTWAQIDLSKPNPYCTSSGQATGAAPASLGTICGVQ